MSDYHYVYILVGERNPKRHYTGHTENLSGRFRSHNNGQVPHTSMYRPWRIETAIAFRSRDKAAEFEKCLKSQSGRAFAREHL